MPPEWVAETDTFFRTVKEATLAAWEREEGWSSGGENSDGGAPVAPVSTLAKKGGRNSQLSSRATNNLKYAQSPWKQPETNINPQWGANARGGAFHSRSPNQRAGGSSQSQNRSWGGPNTRHPTSPFQECDNRSPAQRDSTLADLENRTKQLSMEDGAQVKHR